MLQETHKGTYAGYLASKLCDSFNFFTSTLTACLLDITFKIKPINKSSRATFRLKGLVEALDKSTKLLKTAADSKLADKRLNKFMQNYQDNKKLFIFIPTQKRSDLFTFNINKSKVDKVGVEELKGITNFGCLGIDKDIFISGGENEFQITSNKTFLLHMRTASTLKKHDMRETRCLHTLTLLCKNNVYALGGSMVNQYGRVYLKSTERYSFNNNKWTQCPSLKERKSNIAAVVFNERLIYCFGGYRKEEENIWLSNIEVLDALDEVEGWKVVGRVPKVYDMGIVQVSNVEILVFGGCGERFEWQRASWLFNVHTKALVEVEKNLKQPGRFTQCRCAKYKGHIYALDEDMRDIHLYSIKQKRWFLSPIAELY
jgi:hypothetical protein